MSATLSAFFSKYGMYVAIPGFLLGLGLLIYFITSVIKLVDNSRILSVPLIERQLIEFPEARKVILCGEGPRFTRRFAKLEFLLKMEDGSSIDGRTIWIHSLISGISKVRIDLKSFQIPRPGCYWLEIQGLKESSDSDTEHRIVFMKPYLFRTIGYILGILFSAFLFIGSLVLFFLNLFFMKNKTG